MLLLECGIAFGSNSNMYMVAGAPYTNYMSAPTNEGTEHISLDNDRKQDRAYWHKQTIAAKK